MSIQSRIRVLFVAVVLAANGLVMSNDFPATTTLVEEAGIGIIPKFKTGKKVYDSLGKWIGCVEGAPKQCVMMTIPLTKVFVSNEGILLE